MNPFTNFNHFIAFFLPGLILARTVLAGLSLILDKNLLEYAINLPAQSAFPLIVVLGAIFGLLVDEIRHSWIEERVFEKNRHRQQGYCVACFRPASIEHGVFNDGAQDMVSSR
jgi:hypothetical protein